MVTTRLATAADLPLVKQTLYLALAWDPEDPIPPMEQVVNHPEIVRYHRNWGRAGDAGVVASSHGEFAGMAYCRYFTEEDCGQGFVDSETPELAVAVPEQHRGRGIGTRLLGEIHEEARSTGVTHISLSVSPGNPAARLYHRLGYQLADRASPEIMILEL